MTPERAAAYERLAEAFRAPLARDAGDARPERDGTTADRALRMARFIDVAWPVLAPTGVSWIGFYVAVEVPTSDSTGASGAAASGTAVSGAAAPSTGTPSPDHITEAVELVLAARAPKPACSPIGLHGACGRSLRTGRPLVVRDVRDLGVNYIACDPRDRSEVVVPCLDASGVPWGLLDVDSHDLASFDDDDADRLNELLALAGLSEASQAGSSHPSRAVMHGH